MRLDEGLVQPTHALQFGRQRPGQDDIGARSESWVQVGLRTI